MRTTESLKNTATKAEKIAWLSAQNPAQEFTSLMHHINVGTLQSCFDKLDGKKALGADRVSKDEYGENLMVNLNNLIERMKRMGYRPQPVRQVLIPKEGKPGATRPLGISNFEDKLVQKGMQEILESIYDPIFQDCSYGFRPGRSCHDAIKDLHNHLYRNEVEVVIDVDLANFFD
jgi:RNA-directed DNA polymerase